MDYLVNIKNTRMYQTTLLVLDGESQDTITQVTQALTSAGLKVMRSFDFQDARAIHTSCPCPHHGTDACDCQLVVLLVYEQNKPPLTLVAHGHDGQTHFALGENPAQLQDSHLVVEILQKLKYSYQTNQ